MFLESLRSQREGDLKQGVCGGGKSELWSNMLEDDQSHRTSQTRSSNPINMIVLIGEAALILKILCARSLRNAAAISPEHNVHAGLATQRTLLKRMASQRLGSGTALG
jgi:hypothetical protein